MGLCLCNAVVPRLNPASDSCAQGFFFQLQVWGPVLDSQEAHWTCSDIPNVKTIWNELVGLLYPFIRKIDMIHEWLVRDHNFDWSSLVYVRCCIDVRNGLLLKENIRNAVPVSFNGNFCIHRSTFLVRMTLNMDPRIQEAFLRLAFVGIFNAKTGANRSQRSPTASRFSSVTRWNDSHGPWREKKVQIYSEIV
jgi:hypothetical protein